MAAGNSTPRASTPDLRALGFVRETEQAARSIGLSVTATQDTDSDYFYITFPDASFEEVGAIPAGGLRPSPRLKWCWPAPIAVDRIAEDRIERLRYPDTEFEASRVAHWGLPDDLAAAGIAPAERVRRGARWAKGSSDDRGAWHSRFAPSGRVLYYTSAQACPLTLGRIRQDDALRELIASGEDFCILRTDSDCWVEWVGTTADLTGAGICTDAHFPSGRGRCVTGDAYHKPGVSFWITKALQRGYFRHRCYWGHTDPRPQWLGSSEAAPVRRDSRTPEEFAEACESLFMGFGETLVAVISGELYGAGEQRYDAPTVAKVSAALDHARQLLQQATPALPRAALAGGKRLDDARSDPAFRSFLLTLARDGQAPPTRPRR